MKKVIFITLLFFNSVNFPQSINALINDGVQFLRAEQFENAIEKFKLAIEQIDRMDSNNISSNNLNNSNANDINLQKSDDDKEKNFVYNNKSKMDSLVMGSKITKVPKKITEFLSDKINLLPSTKAHLILLIGYSSFRLGELSEAIVKMNEALKLDNQMAEGYYWRGLLRKYSNDELGCLDLAKSYNLGNLKAKEAYENLCK